MEQLSLCKAGRDEGQDRARPAGEAGVHLHLGVSALPARVTPSPLSTGTNAGLCGQSCRGLVASPPRWPEPAGHGDAALSSPHGAAAPLPGRKAAFLTALFSLCLFAFWFFFLQSKYNPDAVAFISITGGFSCFSFWFPYSSFKSPRASAWHFQTLAPSVFAVG